MKKYNKKRRTSKRVLTETELIFKTKGYAGVQALQMKTKQVIKGKLLEDGTGDWLDFKP